MERMVIGSFATGREAEIAVEHLVQEHGIERENVSVQASGDTNSAGSKAAGADVESGHPSVEKQGEPDLNWPVEVSVDCGRGRTQLVKATFKEAGATRLRSQ